MRLAYLTTEYPAVSHTFIRRELLELEQRGHTIVRLSIRQAKADLPDPLDRAEREKTTAVLGGSRLGLLASGLGFAVTSPAAFCRGLGLAIGMSRKSDRGLLKHVAYAIEAASLMPRLKAERIEHIHVHFGTNAAAVARLVRRMGGPGYSMTCHGPDEFDAVIGLDLPGKIADSSFVIGVSDYGASQLKRWAPPSQWSKIHVVRCTVDAAFAAGDVTPPPATPRFVCVGRLTPQKGQLVLVQAIGILKQKGLPVQVTFAGDGELRRELEAEVARLGVGDLVSISGWIGGARVRELIAESTALVLPSFAEGLPVAIMEAMVLQRPVVSTFVAGIPELVKPGRNGWLVPAGRADLLASVLADVLATSPERLGELGVNARADVMAMHSVRAQVGVLEALLSDATGGSRK